MKNNAASQPRSIAALDLKWSRLIEGEEGKQPETARKLRELIREAEPYELSTCLTEVHDVIAGDGRCLIHCSAKVRSLSTDADDAETPDIETVSGLWLHPAIAAVYHPCEVIEKLQRTITKLDWDGEWKDVENVCNALIDVLGTAMPVRAPNESLARVVRGLSWGRLEAALPATYKKTRAAADAVASAFTITAAAARTAIPSTPSS